jgi:methionyl-tRNA formyltransferase
MRIVFMGTPDFAVKSLESIINAGYEVVGVITAPDKPAGRGQQLQQSAVKQFAVQHQLNVLQPEKLKDPLFIEQLQALRADVQIVVAFRMLPEIVWNMPPLGTFNLHASLLPKYRGAAPINWAVINGETESGITTFKLQHEIDTGHVLFQTKVGITATTTAGELHDALMNEGAILMVNTLKALEQHLLHQTPLHFLPQTDGEATHAPKLFKDTCKINWHQPIEKIYNLIRGLSPYPTAFTEFTNDEEQMLSLKLFRTEMVKVNSNFKPGSIDATNKTLHIYGLDGYLIIHDLQLQGKKRMQTGDFLRGFVFKEGSACK